MHLSLSNRTALAKRALDALAGAGCVASCKGPDLAALIGTTRHYLPQVMRPLVAAGWVISEPGPTGGYRIVPPALDITMLQVVEAVEGPIENARCVLDSAPCQGSTDPCALHDSWVRARTTMIEGLATTRAVEPRRA